MKEELNQFQNEATTTLSTVSQELCRIFPNEGVFQLEDFDSPQEEVSVGHLNNTNISVMKAYILRKTGDLSNLKQEFFNLKKDNETKTAAQIL